MADREVIRTNERAKAATSLLYNLGGALIAAVAVKLYAKFEMSWDVAIWSAGAVALIWSGRTWLSLLDSEA